jgi:hypothetical protein
MRLHVGGSCAQQSRESALQRDDTATGGAATSATAAITAPASGCRIGAGSRPGADWGTVDRVCMIAALRFGSLQPLTTSYRCVFDPHKLHEIARKGVGLPHAQMCQVVVDELKREYPAYISEQEWIYNFAGGAVGVIKLLHCSLSEYLHIFGTPIGTEGFSGRYRVAIHDFVMAGEMWTYTSDRVGVRVITRPGEWAYLRPNQVKGYRLPDGGWMLEYGRGPIITALPFGLADAIFSKVDVQTVWRTMSIYARLTLDNLRRGKI